MKHSRAIFSHQDPRYIVRILDFSHDADLSNPSKSFSFLTRIVF